MPSQKIKEDLLKNKPHLLPGIVNTIIAVMFLVLLIVLKVKVSSFEWKLFIPAVVIVIMLPAAIWYRTYFSKKSKTNQIFNFEKETSLIIDYMKYRKSFVTFQEGSKYKIKAIATPIHDLPLEGFKFEEEDSCLGLPSVHHMVVSVGIGLAGIEIDPTTKKAIGVCGYIPRSIWLKKRCILPISKKGYVTFNTTGFDIRNKTYFISLAQEDTFYDPKSGILCIGDRRPSKIDDTIEFLDGAYLTIRDNKIISLWLKLPEKLPLAI